MIIHTLSKISFCTASSARKIGRPTREGKIHLGKFSAAKPTLTNYLSHTLDSESYSIVHVTRTPVPLSHTTILFAATIVKSLREAVKIRSINLHHNINKNRLLIIRC